MRYPTFHLLAALLGALLAALPVTGFAQDGSQRDIPYEYDPRSYDPNAPAQRSLAEKRHQVAKNLARQIGFGFHGSHIPRDVRCIVVLDLARNSRITHVRLPDGHNRDMREAIAKMVARANWIDYVEEDALFPPQLTLEVQGQKTEPQVPCINVMNRDREIVWCEDIHGNHLPPR